MERERNGVSSTRWIAPLVAGALLASLAACGGKSGRGGSAAPPSALRLPAVGTLRRAPREPATVVVTVTGDGVISMGKRSPMSLEEVRTALEHEAADPRWREPDRSSLRILLVNADERVPWTVSQWVLEIAAAPSVRIYQVFFGARPRAGRVAGAIGWLLPKDQGLAPTRPVRAQESPLRIRVARADQPVSDPEALLPALRASIHGAQPWVPCRIVTASDGKVPSTGAVLRVVDVALRAGVTALRFEGAAPPPREVSGSARALSDYVCRLQAKPAGVAIRLEGPSVRRASEIGAWPEGEPRPPVAGLLADLYGAGIRHVREGMPPTTPTVSAHTDSRALEETTEEVIRDEHPSDDVETDNELPTEESLGGEEPSEGVLTGPTDNGVIGLGGGAGGAFRGRGQAGSSPRDAGAERARKAVEAALAWLAAHQAADGSWKAAEFGSWCEGVRGTGPSEGAGRSEVDVGVTGLAVCAFLGRGYTAQGTSTYAKTVARGLRALRSVQGEDGRFGKADGAHGLWNHAVATVAMVEAYGMTESPLFLAPARKALAWMAKAQAEDGAWHEGGRAEDAEPTAWACLALERAKEVNETHLLPVPFPADEKLEARLRGWLERMPHPRREETGAARLALAALLARRALGEVPFERDAEAEAFLATHPRSWGPNGEGVDVPAWHHATLALAWSKDTSWPTWRDSLREVVLAHQRADTTPCELAGSWDPVGPWSKEGGRVYATALLALCLEAP